MNTKEIIRNFHGRILGYIETDNKGNKIVKDFYGRRLGTYDKENNVTRDFYGRILNRGDSVVSLIFKENK